MAFPSDGVEETDDLLDFHEPFSDALGDFEEEGIDDDDGIDGGDEETGRSAPTERTMRYLRALEEQEDEADDLLPNDTFSMFLLVAPPRRGSLLLAFTVFFVETVTFSFLWRDLIDRDNEDNKLNIPPNVSRVVRACQVLAIFIAVVSQDNVVDSIQMWVHWFRDSEFRANESNARRQLKMPENEKGQTYPFWMWFLSNFLRFAIGILGLSATFALIIISESAFDVLLNFTAVEFVTNLDNVIFGLAARGFMGSQVRRDAKKIICFKEIEHRNSSSPTDGESGGDAGEQPSFALSECLSSLLVKIKGFCATREGKNMERPSTVEQSQSWESLNTVSKMLKKSSLKFVLLIIIFGIMMGFWICLSKKQGTGEYLCRTIFVQFGDDLVPDRTIGHFSGLYERDDLKGWGNRARYTEVVKLNLNGSEVTNSTNYHPARFGYCDKETAWVFARGENAETKPDLCDWNAKSIKTSTYDITSLSSSDWFVKKGSYEIPFDFFHISCYDCDHDNFCGESGRCVKKKNRCECGDGRYGLRCEFDTPSQPIIIDIQAEPFPRDLNPLHEFVWPHQFNIKEGIQVYNRPLYIGKDRENVILFYSGRRWVFFFLADGAFEESINFFNSSFHAFWSRSDLNILFVSGPSDVDTATDGFTPVGLEWFDSRGNFLSPTDTVLSCRNFTFNVVRQAVAKWMEDDQKDKVKRTFGAVGDWDVSLLEDLSTLFATFKSFNDDISAWNMSSVTSTSGMFNKASSFNQPLFRWDVSSVEDMSAMFGEASDFNSDISLWDTSRVRDMTAMFSAAQAFNQDISKWKLSSVKSISSIFEGSVNFDGDISKWNTSAVEDMSSAFLSATRFNQDLSLWDTSAVSDMSNMFLGALFFNGDISTWDTGSVEGMSSMFRGTLAFNRDISSWHTSSVTTMSYMFSETSSFNKDISAWDTSSVLLMAGMFQNATSFNQDLSSWNVTRVTDMRLMFYGASAFNQTLCWGILHPQVNVDAMFCDSPGGFDPDCVSQERIMASKNCSLSS